ncbi:hypothetical protein [Piscinibacter koreensis]|uniref:O-antigen ligase n=1 Tax=Piscinibacter koreensis TaxID=2742824 RepID=A0A7Y6TVJ0_9BURK|nr:hypothetical protein [Schlegelella koreensis]NUZ05179.1 hypothetical protein [Schlegelella koreensis]
MRPLAAALGLGGLGFGGWLALQHPLNGPAVLSLFVAAALLAMLRPRAALVAVFALLPVLSFAPWTGWLVVEEIDLLVLAAVAGASLRHAVTSSSSGRHRARIWPTTALLAIGLFAASSAIAAVLGVMDAGGWAFDLYQGYREPLNSLRLLKPFVWALLLLALWRSEAARDPKGAAAALEVGLVAGLGLAALAALSERLAFTGLLDFSSDYRTTAGFWEMHVGGAAFDGFLALTVPFAIRMLQRPRSRFHFALALGVSALAAYACLTTFSRAIYLAVPMGVALTMWLGSSAEQAPSASRRAMRPWLAASMWLLFCGAALWVFPASGYRGMLALLGACAVLLRLVAAEDAAPGKAWQDLLLASVASSAIVVASAAGVPKGAYLSYGALVLCALGLSFTRAGTRARLAGLEFGIVLGVAAVARHWGGDAALARMLPVVAVLAVLTLAAAVVPRGQAPAPSGPLALRGQLLLVAAMGLAAAGVGVLGGGAYMSGRFSTSEQDLGGRIAHWRDGLAQLRTPIDWTFGIGLGRYPARHALDHAATDAAGDYRVIDGAEGPMLVLTGGRHVLGWGEMLRFSQRIDEPLVPLEVRVRGRAEHWVSLHFDVCEKHLLYEARCATGQVGISAGEWQTVSAALKGPALSAGNLIAPRPIVFSIANETPGSRVEIAELSVRDATGTELLRNRTFSQRGAHWFFSSDRNHMPWHLKNVLVHTLFEQGVTGLIALLTLVGVAFARVAAGDARTHPLAPPIAGALAGFAIVGAFDSLLDVPRVSLLFFVLVLIASTDRLRTALPPSPER